MPRTNLDGKSIKRTLEWLLNRDVKDAELAEALGLPESTYSRRKDHDDYPTYEDLAALAAVFKLSARALQIVFGNRDLDEVGLLKPRELRQYLEMGGGNHPDGGALMIVALGKEWPSGWVGDLNAPLRDPQDTQDSD